eukprot:2256842-Karenia_brevis.AAC.1
MSGPTQSSWTYARPSGSLHRIDSIIMRGRGNKGTAAHGLFDLPVSLSGYRVHRPSQTVFYPGAVSKIERKRAQRMQWNRALLQQAVDWAAWYDGAVLRGDNAEKSALISH